MTQYASQVVSALKLIAKYGGPAVLVVTTAATPDPNKPWETPPDTEQTAPVKAAFLRYEQRYIDNDVIHAGDQKVLIAASGLPLVPNLQGRVERVVNGITEYWKVMNVSPLNVNGQEPILYTLQVRQ